MRQVKMGEIHKTLILRGFMLVAKKSTERYAKYAHSYELLMNRHLCKSSELFADDSGNVIHIIGP